MLPVKNTSNMGLGTRLTHLSVKPGDCVLK